MDIPNHRRVVQLQATFAYRGSLCLVTELQRGSPLQKGHRRGPGPHRKLVRKTNFQCFRCLEAFLWSMSTAWQARISVFWHVSMLPHAQRRVRFDVVASAVQSLKHSQVFTVSSNIRDCRTAAMVPEARFSCHRLVWWWPL